MSPMRILVSGLLVGAGLVLGACDLRSGQERAELDEQVGRGGAGGVQVTVAGGLAALRRIEPGRIELWAQAPVLELEVAVGEGAGGRWTLACDNALADAGLMVTGPQGPVAVEELPGQPRPTRRAWNLELPAGQTLHLQLAPPDAAALDPWHFAVLSDIQDAVDRVQDLFTAIERDPRLRFVVSAGDLTESGSGEQLDRILEELESLDVPFYATSGNHDQFAGEPRLWHERLGRFSLHFRFRGVHFSLVDSSDASIDPRVYDWLDGWLDQAAEQPHVFVTHFPALDPVGVRAGALRSRNEAGKLLTRLARGGVDLCLYGHVHTFQAFSNAGIPAFVSGGGGAIPERLDGIERHFLHVEVDPRSGRFLVAPVEVD